MSTRESSRARWFRNRCTWLPASSTIPRELAEGVIQAANWWLAHGTNRDPVQAPGMARFVVRTADGWVLPYGANKLLIEQWIMYCRTHLNDSYALAELQQPVGLESLANAFARAATEFVMDYKDEVYISYPEDHGFLRFGTHAFDTLGAAWYLIRQSGLPEAITLDTRHSPARHGAGSQEGHHEVPATRRKRSPAPERSGRADPPTPTEVNQQEWVSSMLMSIEAVFGSTPTVEQKRDLRKALVAMHGLLAKESRTAEEERRLKKIQDYIYLRARHRRL